MGLNSVDAAVSTPLAIVGIGCLFPGSRDLDAYWARIKGGKDSITEVPSTHWRPEDYFHPDPKAPDRVYALRGGFLEPIDFNPAAFGIAPTNLEAIDTSQLLGLVVAQQALADAGYGEGRGFDRSRVSVILGVTGTLELVIPLGARLGHPIWRRALREAGVEESVAEDVVRRIADSYVGWQENSFPGLLGNVVAGRIANRFDLGGTNCVVDAACASSLAALHLAALELASGRSDLVLTGGVDTFNDVFMYTCFSKTPALSPTGNARPFDAGADGTILGEGVGMVVLKRLADAERDGDRIYAVVRGIGTSSDGKGDAVYAPKKEGQVEALRSAYRAAGVGPDTVELVEAHGTGTRVGDATEVQALKEVYGSQDGTWCALGSVKSQVGHTKAAAGVAGLIKAAAALHHKVLPPTIKVQQPLDILEPGQSPFYVNTTPRPWLPSDQHPRRAAVSAFGFGGSNYHCVLEEAQPSKTTPDWDGSVEILAFSGETKEVEAQLAAWPAARSWEQVRAWAARSRAEFRPEAGCRLLLVVERDRGDIDRLIADCRARLADSPGGPQPAGAFKGRGPRAGKLAVLFPGQGAQYPGMLRELACQFPTVLDTLARAEASFAGATKGRLIDRIYPLAAFTDEQRHANMLALQATDTAQPALGAIELGAWRVLQALGVQADAFAGHSYGELTALCASGRLEESSFHALSLLRGQLMAAQAVGDAGAMLAVQAPQETIETVLYSERLELVLANKNGPAQTVLSGPVAEIEKAAAAFAKWQIRSQRLVVAAAFHSPLVAGAEAPFRAALENVSFEAGCVPVYANTTAAPYPDDAAQARALLAGQLARPVEFVTEIEALHAAGVRTFVEVGPGARLTGLVRAILEGREHEAVALDRSSGQRSGIFDLACCLATLAARGYPVDLRAWEKPVAEEPPSALGRIAMHVSLCGANYVKPRPRREPAPQVPAPPLPPVPSAPVEAAASPPPPAARNGSSKLTMNGSSTPAEAAASTRSPARSSSPPAPLPQPQGNRTALDEALQITRDSLTSLQKMQEQTAQLHRHFLEGQESAQRTVHLLVEQQQRLLQAALGLPVAEAPRLLPVTQRQDAERTKTGSHAERGNQEGESRKTGSHAKRGNQEGERPSASIQTERDTHEVSVTAAPTQETERVLVEVVSEKTGYPPELLDLDMALDADLGIDSIKRVEILSALQERLPEAPAIKPEHLGTLHSLRHIAAFLAGTTGDTASSASSCPAPSSTADTERVLVEVVSEKTGYPPELLDLDMALDADLGIDSIKRVEILSALQERLPEAPAIKPEHLGTLHSLRHIAAFLAGTEAKAIANGSSAETNGKTLPVTPSAGQAPLERSVLAVVDLQPAGRPSIRLEQGAEIWLSADDTELASGLEKRLRDLGYRPRTMPVALLREQDAPAKLSGLVIVAPPDGVGERFLEDALFGVHRAAAGLRRAGQEGTALLATVSRLDGAFGLKGLDAGRGPLDGGLAGLTKTAAHEWPQVHCKALDLAADFATPDEAARALVKELFLAWPVEVGLSASSRCTLERIPQPLPAGSAEPLGAGDVVVLSGGARGVTAEVAVALAAAFQPTLVLLGRSPMPESEPSWLEPLADEAEIKRALTVRANGDATPRLIADQYQSLTAQREIRSTLARIEAAGGRAVYRSVDVRHPAAVAAVLAEVQSELGPVRGLIHGAGVLADARIEDKTPEQFQRVYSTKVNGLSALLDGIDMQDLRLLVLFSSSTARFGRSGQVDYAIANEVLNKRARQLARLLPACRVLSINWGPWDGGMVTVPLKKLFAQEGVGLISPEAGADLLVRELRAGDPSPVEVVVLGPGTRIAPPAPPAVHTAPPSPPSRALPLAFERVLERAEYPVLESHILDGRPVVPMALLLEWLAHGALHQNPGLLLHGCDDLRVLHGVILDGPEAPTLRVVAGKAIQHEGLYVAQVELRGQWPGGREVLHARAEVVLTSLLPEAPVPLEQPELSAYPHSPEAAYRDLLFHGPDLFGIEQVEGCGPQGIAARVRPAPAPARWLRQPLRQRWLTDPLVLDSSFQLMILWSIQQKGSPCLPCALAHYRQFRRTFPHENVRVVVRIVRATELHVLADVDYLDQTGQLIARSEGLECVIDPSLRRSFRRQQLVPALP